MLIALSICIYAVTLVCLKEYINVDSFDHIFFMNVALIVMFSWGLITLVKMALGCIFVSVESKVRSLMKKDDDLLSSDNHDLEDSELLMMD